ncbi:hypothetical protein K7C20_35905 [Streptomyces decoyicus]|nr:hypothetical protein K7C20_35905 [Streptomyces decoyicus]
MRKMVRAHDRQPCANSPADVTAEMPGEEPDRAVGLEPGKLLMPARVGVQRLFLRGEGVEQRETGWARVCSSSHWRTNSTGTVICFALSARESCQKIPKTAAAILGSIAASGTLRQVRVVTDDDRADRRARRHCLP